MHIDFRTAFSTKRYACMYVCVCVCKDWMQEAEVDAKGLPHIRDLW